MHICIIYIYIYIQVGTDAYGQSTNVWGRGPLGILASKTPNRGLESCVCCWIAWPELAQKDVFFHRHQEYCPDVLSPHLGHRPQGGLPILGALVLFVDMFIVFIAIDLFKKRK